MIPTAESPDIFGTTVFCDDIRQEVGGKSSFIGVYESGLVIHTAFPATLPKFGFAISLSQRRTVFKSDISVRIYMPEDEDEKPSIEAQLMGDTLPLDKIPGAGDFLTLRAHLVTTGLVIKAPGLIKARALREGVLIRLGSITVQAAPKNDDPASSQSATAPTV